MLAEVVDEDDELKKMLYFMFVYLFIAWLDHVLEAKKETRYDTEKDDNNVITSEKENESISVKLPSSEHHLESSPDDIRKAFFSNATNKEELEINTNCLVIEQKSKPDLEMIDGKVQSILSIFPEKSVDELLENINAINLNEECDSDLNDWILRETVEKERQEVFNNRYETLQACFPNNGDLFWVLKATEFDFTPGGSETFREWVFQNKLEECKCCFDADGLEKDMLSCPRGHMFCKNCIEQGSKVALGDGKRSLDCLTDCDSSFDLTVLHRALNEELYSKWVSIIQASEVEKANIEGFVSCPFCSFGVIIETSPEIHPVLYCQRPDCGKSSCRLCLEESHLPLSCKENERKDEVRKRTFIENKMSEAMMRNCVNCKKPLVKNGGCNWVTCTCGTKMCYFCRSTTCSTTHDTHDENIAHKREVFIEGEKAKSTMNKELPNVKLRHDPTKFYHDSGTSGHNFVSTPSYQSESDSDSD